MNIITKLRDKWFNKNNLDTENAIKLFQEVKNSVITVDDDKFDAFIAKAEKLHAKYLRARQIATAAKVRWMIKLIDKERQLVRMGYNKCVFRDEVSKFAESHKTRAINICNIEDYPREIPDEVVDIIENTKDIFNALIVVYTDYTKNKEVRKKEVIKTKDPILFGVFLEEIEVDKDKNGNPVIGNVMSDRLYYLADWEDKYCDLTWNRMMSEGAFTKTDLDTIGSAVFRLDSIIQSNND